MLQSVLLDSYFRSLRPAAAADLSSPPAAVVALLVRFAVTNPRLLFGQLEPYLVRLLLSLLHELSF